MNDTRRYGKPWVARAFVVGLHAPVFVAQLFRVSLGRHCSNLARALQRWVGYPHHLFGDAVRLPLVHIPRAVDNQFSLVREGRRRDIHSAEGEPTFAVFFESVRLFTTNRLDAMHGWDRLLSRRRSDRGPLQGAGVALAALFALARGGVLTASAHALQHSRRCGGEPHRRCRCR